MKVLIIGGVAGGASCAARLRRLDEGAEIIIIEKGEFISFANCGLPYYIGGVIENEDALTLQTPESFRRRFNIDVRTQSEAVSVDPEEKTVTVRDLQTGREYKENYDKLVLAPGAHPVVPNIEGLDSGRVFTLRNIPDTRKIKDFIEKDHPAAAAVVGGGHIGLEMAENLKKAGLEVTVVELGDHVIAALDKDMASEVQRYIKGRGIILMTGTGVTAVKEDKDGLTVKLTKGEIKADMLILSVGVSPESALAKSAKITVTPKSCIAVDSRMQTSNKDIYAVGDAVQVRNFITGEHAFIPLAGPASKQGRIAADNICGITSEYKGSQGSSVLKLFDMTVAVTGLNEAMARAADIDYDKTYIYSASHATYYPGASLMCLKVLWERSTHRIIGAQAVGFEGVDKRMDVLAAAIRFGARVTELAQLELCYAPPFGSAKDPVNMVGFVAENVIEGKVGQFFWHDVANIPRDGSVTLLDVRTDAERKDGGIDGFIHIPLDSLRDSIGLIPKSKPVYVHCHSGQRSYIACRILSGMGYECYNLAGGWRLYEAVTGEYPDTAAV